MAKQPWSHNFYWIFVHDGVSHTTSHMGQSWDWPWGASRGRSWGWSWGRSWGRSWGLSSVNFSHDYNQMSQNSLFCIEQLKLQRVLQELFRHQEKFLLSWVCQTSPCLNVWRLEKTLRRRLVPLGSDSNKELDCEVRKALPWRAIAIVWL